MGAISNVGNPQDQGNFFIDIGEGLNDSIASGTRAGWEEKILIEFDFYDFTIALEAFFKQLSEEGSVDSAWQIFKTNKQVGVFVIASANSGYVEIIDLEEHVGGFVCAGCSSKGKVKVAFINPGVCSSMLGVSLLGKLSYLMSIRCLKRGEIAYI